MFTGIIEERGEVAHVEPSGDGLRITVHGPLVVNDAQRGDSITVNGVCLTVVDRSESTFTADVMAETVAVTTLATAIAGTKVNLERSVKLDDRLGGHIVQGHTDGTACVLAVTPGKKWTVARLSLPANLAPLVAHKGSIAVDGVSLTVSAISPSHEHGRPVAHHWFEVSLIPETLAATTLGTLAVGHCVNLETDIFARYAARMLAMSNPTETDAT